MRSFLIWSRNYCLFNMNLCCQLQLANFDSYLFQWLFLWIYHQYNNNNDMNNNNDNNNNNNNSFLSTTLNLSKVNNLNESGCCRRNTLSFVHLTYLILYLHNISFRFFCLSIYWVKIVHLTEFLTVRLFKISWISVVLLDLRSDRFS